MQKPEMRCSALLLHDGHICTSSTLPCQNCAVQIVAQTQTQGRSHDFRDGGKVTATRT